MFTIKYGGENNLNNDMIVKCKISNNLGTALKKILEKQELTQQDFLQKIVEKYILEHITLVLESDKK